MATYVVLLGPPGAGKGTQAKRLVLETGIPHVSTGDLFRAMKTLDTPLAREIQAILASGALVPDEVTIRVLEERINEADTRENGAILDGFPRTVPQAEALDRALSAKGSQIEVVLYMDVSENEAVRRISGRRTCKKCGRIYHVEFNPPKNEGKCDDDGKELLLRTDDAEDVVRARFQVYQKNTSVLVAHYRKKGLLVEIDATQAVKTITPQMVKAIRQATTNRVD